MSRGTEEHQNNDLPKQLTLLTAEQLRELERPSTLRGCEGKVSSESDGVRKSYSPTDSSAQPKLPFPW